MKTVLTLSAAFLLTLGATQATLAQGRGHDKDRGGDKHQDKDDNGKGDKHRDKDDNGKGDKHGGGKDRPGKDAKPEPWVRGADDKSGHRGKDGRDHPIVVVDSRPDRPVVVLVPYRERVLIKGCPPGLAKKHNGCLPPGQARKLAGARYDWLWGRPADGYRVRYEDGYLYRLDRQGSLLGYLPALGGALSVGKVWPARYTYEPAPSYQAQYYGLNQPYDYRYADGAIYGVDQKTSSIQQVVALLTGQSAQIGQPMPSGYDVYNVPYAYRAQYPDTAQSAYRYNDGALYQLDPKTQVVQAIIQLLT